jgi:DNA-directed RNA polymerase specialized sigma24 family protein
VEAGEFSDWYVREHRRVVASLAAVSGNADAARDAADEAFVRALAHWERVRVMDAPAGWVYRVAMNVLRRDLRRRRRETVLLRRRTQVVAPLPTHPELWEAVRALPERQRIAVVLRFVADLPEAEIASVMGIARGTVSATLSAARASLARWLDETPSEVNR